MAAPHYRRAHQGGVPNRPWERHIVPLCILAHCTRCGAVPAYARDHYHRVGPGDAHIRLPPTQGYRASTSAHQLARLVPRTHIHLVDRYHLTHSFQFNTLICCQTPVACQLHLPSVTWCQRLAPTTCSLSTCRSLGRSNQYIGISPSLPRMHLHQGSTSRILLHCSLRHGPTRSSILRQRRPRYTFAYFLSKGPDRLSLQFFFYQRHSSGLTPHNPDHATHATPHYLLENNKVRMDDMVLRA